MMVEMHRELFAALAKSWGARGWTSLSLADCPPDIARPALERARENVLKKPKSRK
jgi:hypothetical protein